jgi:CDP-diacylglycerol--glycerol-3-phosphate 3-phosphatidyltransferase
MQLCLSPVAARLSLGLVTTANKVTILRILLIPFFVVEVLYYVKTGNEVHRLVALLTFAVAAICDGVDGYIARHYNQWSELGTILDPLADKLLLVSGVVLLSFDHAPYLGQIPLWLTGTIIGRDLLLLIGLIVIQMTVGRVKVRPHVIGKVATVLQMVCVLWILLAWDAGWGARWTGYWNLSAAICTGVSGLLYVWDGVRQLSASPSSSAAKSSKH